MAHCDPLPTVDQFIPLGPLRRIVDESFRLHQFLGPAAETRLFLEQYEATYGPQHPPFFSQSYSQTLDEAKRNLKFMLVYLHSAEHDDTPTFCRNVLGSDAFLAFIASHEIICWAGDVQQTEAYRVSDALQVTGYPFLALICLKSGRMQVVDRIYPTFAETAETLMERLTASMTIHGHALAAARADRQAQESARRIRADQDSAYLESLRADQAKARQEQAAREQAERERREAEERARREEEERVKAARAVPEEPAEGEAGCTKIVVRLPDGSRLERRFRATDTIGALYRYVQSRPEFKVTEGSKGFTLGTTFPKRSFEDHDVTLADAQLVPNGVVFVTEK